MTNLLMQMLEHRGVPTHFVQELNERETVVKKVTIVPLEVIVRNLSAGHFARTTGWRKASSLRSPPSSSPIRTMTWATPSSIPTMPSPETGDPGGDRHHRSSGLPDQRGLKEFFLAVGITLVDFKLEFGRLEDGTIVLADEISPDTCRLWDKETGEKLDKDRFRRDLGNVEGAYQEVMKRLTGSQP